MSRNESKNLKEVLGGVNETYFLPDIQRNFEWDKGQILELFDSAMKGYPIGSFLFWEVDGDDVDDYIKYNFIEDYIDQPNYPSKLKGRSHYNKKVSDDYESVPNKVQMVLDGQQRITAFYIGFLGSFTEKKVNYSNDKMDSYERKKLCINLLSNPERRDSELDVQYDFDFKELPAEKTEDEYWYEVSNIIDVDEKYDEVRRVQEDMMSLGIKNVPMYSGKIIDRLYSIYHNEEIIGYSKVEEDDYRKILQIFLRANDAGTKLSNKDLMLSIASSVWNEEISQIDNDRKLVAREEIYHYTADLDSHPASQGRSSPGVNFILKCLLTCSGQSPSFRYEDMSEEDLIDMKKVWQDDDFKDSVEKSLSLLDEYGLNTRHIKTNYLIPIVYYIYTKQPKLNWKYPETRRRRQEIFKFICISRLANLMQSGVDYIVDKSCQAIDEMDKDFKIQTMQDKFEGREGATLRLNEDVLGEKFRNLGNQKNDKLTRIVLRMLYGKPTNPDLNYEIDHIYPKSTMKEETLVDKHDMDRDKARNIDKSVDRIGNLQLIEETENKVKSDKKPSMWENKPGRKIKYLPKNVELEPENYFSFVSRREEKMQEYILDNYQI